MWRGYCMITTIRHSGKGRTIQNIKRIIGCQGLGKEKGINRQNTEDFKGSENSLYDTITMSYTLVPIHRMYNTTARVNSNVNYGFGVIKMCQCRLTKGTTLQRDMTIEEAIHVCGQWIYGKSLYLSLNFAMNLIQLQKNNVLIKIFLKIK